MVFRGVFPSAALALHKAVLTELFISWHRTSWLIPFSSEYKDLKKKKSYRNNNKEKDTIPENVQGMRGRFPPPPQNGHI